MTRAELDYLDSMDADCPCALSKEERTIGAKYWAELSAGRERVAELRREQQETRRDWRADAAERDRFFAMGRSLAQRKTYADELDAIPDWAKHGQRARDLEAVLRTLGYPAPA